jgi:DNA invertase Pin-like site-specific DNA recombinase
VSTRDQADNGHSLEAQRAKIEAYAVLHDLELTDVAVDDGYSGKNLERPGMERLLDLIRRRAVDVVVVAKLDRITRSVRDLGDLIERFQSSGVEFASVADNIDTTTASGRLVLNVMGSVAQWERETIGERTADALAHLRANGKRTSRFAPFGHLLEANGELTPDPHEQEAVALIRRLRADRMTLNGIAEELAARGFHARNGQRLSAKVVRSVLMRRT